MNLIARGGLMNVIMCIVVQIEGRKKGFHLTTIRFFNFWLSCKHVLSGR
jgi:hypothetical protein